MPPQALGELMLVPFISCEPRSVQFGTDAIAAPGALMHTPSAPSCLHSQLIVTMVTAANVWLERSVVCMCVSVCLSMSFSTR